MIGWLKNLFKRKDTPAKQLTQEQEFYKDTMGIYLGPESKTDRFGPQGVWVLDDKVLNAEPGHVEVPRTPKPRKKRKGGSA